ncbi:uncharacterized protein LOC127864423 isoform X2 [Dreissena polymorpha]|uniref:uncharacterized protein LOC127864423 isoform X2 n=1 Tax=Dreissena polymorpha TaxID=45954 RepID=UPI0022641BFF|nr:uncharacterized protein LOC127864423 isoform X2 [Dreissena polymorpha]
MATQSDRVFFFGCVSCKKNKNIEEYAVYYCEKCQQCFCRQCCELHHDYLFSEHVKHDRLNMRNWPVSKELEAVILMCEIHTHKKLETICKDHSQLCCSKCVSLSHRKCKKVTLNSAKKQAPEVQELFEKLLINMRKLRKLQSCCESGIQDLKSSYQGQELMVHKMNDKIKSTMAKIVRRTLKKIPKVEQNKIHELMHSTLFHIENITLNEAKITLSSLEDSLKTGVETCIRHHHELKALHELLLYSSDNNNKKLCIIASRKCIDKIQQVVSYLDENSVKLECSVLQQTIQGTEQYIVRLSGLGRLKESMKAHTDIEQYLSKLSGLMRVVGPNYVFTVQGKSRHTVRIPSDSESCSITAICVLPDGQVLLADRNNKKVKLLNQQYHAVSHLDVRAKSQDICQITPSEVAVAVTYRNIHEVQFITVIQGQLTLGKMFQLQHGCTVDKCAVSPTGDRLYITSYRQNKLLTLARDGTLLATYTDPALDGPYGLHVTPAGQVLVCGWGSNTVLQVDSEGKSKLATLATQEDGVSYPWSVCYSSTTSSIIVGQWWGDNILVFRVE